ncbi:hypothetical protein FCR2A7T_09830 [Flavobacterium cauense R2A-7]|nr:hypothetical protein FCR2A7T_09830 [Flavobacterium cauense R2A-7]KGO82949.1 hypothetical protein Q762_04145 [Flavobacterium cauense R2A-7]
MTILFIISWVLSFGFAVFGIIYFIIGITYKNWKKILLSIFGLIISVSCYYLPYYILIELILKQFKK